MASSLSLEYPFAFMEEGIVSLSNGLMLALQARKRLAATLAQESALLQVFYDIKETGAKRVLSRNNNG
jgi:hypothetical protein